jgi:hypothetical protein
VGLAKPITWGAMERSQLVAIVNDTEDIVPFLSKMTPIAPTVGVSSDLEEFALGIISIGRMATASFFSKFLKVLVHRKKKNIQRHISTTVRKTCFRLVRPINLLCFSNPKRPRPSNDRQYACVFAPFGSA